MKRKSTYSVKKSKEGVEFRRSGEDAVEGAHGDETQIKRRLHTETEESSGPMGPR